MSFDILLQAFRNGVAATGNREGVVRALGKVHFRAISSGVYQITTDDGATVELSAQGLDGSMEFTGCTFFVRRMSPQLLATIFDVAKMGNMVIIPTSDAAGFVLTLPEQLAELPVTPELPEPVLCHSGRELGFLLGEGITRWQRYRDQINERPMDTTGSV